MSTKTPPQHGERRCYLRGCKRAECVDAHYRYMSRLRLEYQRGQRRRTDTAHVTAHVHRLLDAGWLQAQIARVAGLNHRTICEVVRAGHPTVSNATARRILAIPVGCPPNDAVDIDATGTIRRLRALVAIGHNYRDIAAHVGIHPDALGLIARGDRAGVRVTTAEAVASAYRHMSRTPGKSARSRLQAQHRDWHGPLAWDAIDDPNAEPEVDDTTGNSKRPRVVADPARVLRLTKQDKSAAQIAEILGVHKRTVTRVRTKARKEMEAAA